MISEHDRQILKALPAWNPTGDIAAQRRAWEELAVIYNRDLPAVGALEENIELRSGLHADVAVPKGDRPASGGDLPARRWLVVRQPGLVPGASACGSPKRAT